MSANNHFRTEQHSVAVALYRHILGEGLIGMFAGT
jgi:hypothetical protein